MYFSKTHDSPATEVSWDYPAVARQLLPLKTFALNLYLHQRLHLVTYQPTLDICHNTWYSDTRGVVWLYCSGSSTASLEDRLPGSCLLSTSVITPDNLPPDIKTFQDTDSLAPEVKAGYPAVSHQLLPLQTNINKSNTSPKQVHEFFCQVSHV